MQIGHMIDTFVVRTFVLYKIAHKILRKRVRACTVRVQLYMYVYSCEYLRTKILSKVLSYFRTFVLS